MPVRTRVAGRPAVRSTATEGCRQTDRQRWTDGWLGQEEMPVPAPLGPLTRVDVFLVSPQGIPALQPLPTAAGLAHEPGFAPARLLVLLAAAGQERGRRRL